MELDSVLVRQFEAIRGEVVAGEVIDRGAAVQRRARDQKCTVCREDEASTRT
jgi:hypothetical protein